MSTAKQAAANRRNARLSRGPRSTAGKQRVSHNARRHGLSISITADRAFGEQIVHFSLMSDEDKKVEPLPPATGEHDDLDCHLSGHRLGTLLYWLIM
jgi:hypothetical protein